MLKKKTVVSYFECEDGVPFILFRKYYEKIFRKKLQLWKRKSTGRYLIYWEFSNYIPAIAWARAIIAREVFWVLLLLVTKTNFKLKVGPF